MSDQPILQSEILSQYSTKDLLDLVTTVNRILKDRLGGEEL